MRAVFFILLFPILMNAQSRVLSDTKVSPEYMIEQINALRATGCTCGGAYMKPVGPVQWNEVLVRSAGIHARRMHKHNFFAHIGPYGDDVGDRMEKVGYRWQYAGENLGEGQRSFNQVLKDWKKSPSHCKLLMDPNMIDMAISRYGRFWVQHFGKELPSNMYRKNERYREGSR